MSRLRTALAPWLAAAACATALTVLAPTAAVAGPVYEADERALATATPSLAFIEIIYKGYLRNVADGTPVVDSQIIYSRRCSGFVVNPISTVLSTANCVQLGERLVRQMALGAAARTLVKEKKLASAEIAGFIRTNLDTSVFGGRTQGSEPDIKLHVQLDIATAGTERAPAILGKVQTSVPAGPGGIAVIQLPVTGLPAVELSSAERPESGSSVLLLGFGTLDTDQQGGRYTPMSKSARVIGTGSDKGATWLRVDADLGSNSTGGMVLDLNGRLVGMLQRDPAVTSGAHRAVTTAADLSKAMVEAGAANSLAEPDRTYRLALDDYFRGRYETAIAGFDKVIVASPLNETARAYRQQAIDWQAIEGDTSEATPVWLTALLAAVSGAAISFFVTLVILLLRRSSRRRVEVEAAARLGGSRSMYALPGPSAPPALTTGAAEGHQEPQPSVIIDGGSEPHGTVSFAQDGAPGVDNGRQ